VTLIEISYNKATEKHGKANNNFRNLDWACSWLIESYTKKV